MSKHENKDEILLEWLRSNSRLPLTKISRKTHIPISTLFDRLKEQEKSLITKHTTLIDFSRLGYHTKVHLFLKTPTETKKSLERHLKTNKKINSIYKVADKYHFMVEAIFKHLSEYKDFLEDLEERFAPLTYQSYFIAQDLKRESFLAQEQAEYGISAK
ncbi:MAG: Lrp/AsnC family transcriptional regulator [Nanobdellota archaeon]